jgi:hypothetical protein
MNSKKTEEKDAIVELPDEWWYKVYLAVISFTIVIILSLWAFSHYFSN